MTEPADTTPAPSRVSRLLLKAVSGLPEEEQRVVFEYFLERGIAFPQATSGGSWRDDIVRLRESSVRVHGAEPGALATLFTAQKLVGPDQIMIPVRLSEDQHRRLKEWCAEHNFPMAVVVRGLIERFLDSWEKRAG